MSLEDTFHSLEAAYREWVDFLGNPNYCRIHNSISWHNREKIWLRDEFDYETYATLATKRQYSFVTSIDGGIIQLYYEYASNGLDLIAASASFYGPSRETIIDDPSLIEMAAHNEDTAEWWAESEGDFETSVDAKPSQSNQDSELDYESGTSALISFIPSVRIDYTPKARRPFVHESCHLHIPGFGNARIHVNCFPSPEQFVEMIFAWFYPSIYSDKYSSKQMSEDQYRVSRTIVQKKYWHHWHAADSPSALPWLHFSHHERTL